MSLSRYTSKLAAFQIESMAHRVMAIWDGTMMSTLFHHGTHTHIASIAMSGEKVQRKRQVYRNISSNKNSSEKTKRRRVEQYKVQVYYFQLKVDWCGFGWCRIDYLIRTCRRTNSSKLSSRTNSVNFFPLIAHLSPISSIVTHTVRPIQMRAVKNHSRLCVSRVRPHMHVVEAISIMI